MMTNVGKPTITNSNVFNFKKIKLNITLILIFSKFKKLLASIPRMENVAMTIFNFTHQRSLNLLNFVLYVNIFYPSNSVKNLLKYSNVY